MLTEQDIEKFYCDLESMKLRKPNAVMRRASGLSSGNVSEYLNRKKPPSESFIKAFYEKVYKPSTNALLAENKEVKQNNIENVTLDTIREIAAGNNKLADANKDMAASNKTLAENNSDLIKMLKETSKFNSIVNPQRISEVLEPYLQQLALGLAGRYGKDEHAWNVELNRILHEHEVAGKLSHKD